MANIILPNLSDEDSDSKRLFNNINFLKHQQNINGKISHINFTKLLECSKYQNNMNQYWDQQNVLNSKRSSYLSLWRPNCKSFTDNVNLRNMSYLQKKNFHIRESLDDPFSEIMKQGKIWNESGIICEFWGLDKLGLELDENSGKCQCNKSTNFHINHIRGENWRRNPMKLKFGPKYVQKLLELTNGRRQSREPVSINYHKNKTKSKIFKIYLTIILEI